MGTPAMAVLPGEDSEIASGNEIVSGRAEGKGAKGRQTQSGHALATRYVQVRMVSQHSFSRATCSSPSASPCTRTRRCTRTWVRNDPREGGDRRRVHRPEAPCRSRRSRRRNPATAAPAAGGRGGRLEDNPHGVARHGERPRRPARALLEPHERAGEHLGALHGADGGLERRALGAVFFDCSRRRIRLRACGGKKTSRLV